MHILFPELFFNWVGIGVFALTIMCLCDHQSWCPLFILSIPDLRCTRYRFNSDTIWRPCVKLDVYDDVYDTETVVNYYTVLFELTARKIECRGV